MLRKLESYSWSISTADREDGNFPQNKADNNDRESGLIKDIPLVVSTVPTRSLKCTRPTFMLQIVMWVNNL